MGEEDPLDRAMLHGARVDQATVTSSTIRPVDGILAHHGSRLDGEQSAEYAEYAEPPGMTPDSARPQYDADATLQRRGGQR